MKLSHKFLHLSLEEKDLFVKVSFLLIVYRVVLRLLPFKKLLLLIDRFTSPTVPKDLDQDYSEKYVQAVSRAGNYLLRKNICLPQALAVYTMLKHYGEPAKLQIGVRKDQHGNLEAHAWVENRGKVIIGGAGIDLERYVRLHGLNGGVI